MTGYATRDVSELIGFNADQVRHYVRRGLLTPERGGRGEYRFSFQDVVLLRTAKGLVDAQGLFAPRLSGVAEAEGRTRDGEIAVRGAHLRRRQQRRRARRQFGLECRVGPGPPRLRGQRTRGQRRGARPAQDRDVPGNGRTRQRRLVQPRPRPRRDRTRAGAGSVSAGDRAGSDQRRCARQSRPPVSDERPTEGSASLLPQSARVRCRTISSRCTTSARCSTSSKSSTPRPSTTVRRYVFPMRTTTSRASARCGATNSRRCGTCANISSCSKRSTDFVGFGSHRRGSGCTGNGVRSSRTRGKCIHVARPRLPASDGPAHRSPSPLHTQITRVFELPTAQNHHVQSKHRPMPTTLSRRTPCVAHTSF